ncbi:MAG: T9SS type A sorting domain-containing protein [Bacteroidales bacterium]|nr:T9SS type A sorting domain-containing protein [Bacteroidales bacterium]
MKKALLALGLVMCGSLVMAQTAKKVQKPLVGERADIKIATAPVDYKASIFTKADDVVVKTFTFAQTEMTGITYGETAAVNAGDMLDGSAVAAADAHGMGYANSYWARINSIEDCPSATDTTVGKNFVATYPNAYNYGANSLRTYMGEPNNITEDNGFMFISLIEHFMSQPINAYFTLPSQALPAGAKVVDVQFRQFYRKFYDHTYIDYKLADGWHSVEVNVVNVDVDVNGTGSAAYVCTLPAAVGESGNAELRFRAFGNTGNQLQPHGYMWAVDEVSIVVPGSEARWSFSQNGYLDGFYGMLPQGFEIPMGFTTSARNRGVADLTNVKLSVKHHLKDEATGEFTTTNVVSASQANMPSGDVSKDYILEINERGTMVPGVGLNGNTYGNTGVGIPYAQTWPLYWETYGDSADVLKAQGWGLASLPTEVEGKNFFSIVGEADGGENGLSTVVADTMAYTVSTYMDEDANRGLIAGYRWSHDNGVIPSNSEFSYQFTADGYVTYQGEDQYAPGYELFTRYTSPAAIPLDGSGNPWVIRGVEYVTATTLASISNFGGTLITPLALQFAILEGDTDYNIYYMNTGLSSSDVVSVPISAKPEEEYGYTMPDAKYRALNVTFPNQPALQPSTAYLFGYENQSGGPFSVAEIRSYFRVNADSSSYYRDNEELADYSFQLNPLLKVYDVYCYDPVNGNAQTHTISGWNIDVYPMIRAIVGPAVEIPTFEISFDCGNTEGEYWFGTLNYNENICGEVGEFYEGSSYSFNVFPGADNEDEEGVYGNRVITDIKINGVSQNLKDTTMFIPRNYDVVNSDHQDWDVMLERSYYEMSVRNISDNYIITVETEERELSINDVENYVKVALAPNPATQQVRVDVAGVNGMVDCSIIDMSGREVYSSKFNASNEQVIDLSNIPAGAYFVRITNSTFSKVEKLIVR